MKEDVYWIYQERENCEKERWALRVVKTWQTGYPEFTRLQITIYSDGIDNPDNCIGYMPWHSGSASGYVDWIVAALYMFTPVLEADIEQLEREIAAILAD